MNGEVFELGDSVYLPRHNKELSRLLSRVVHGNGIVHEIWQNSNGVEYITYRPPERRRLVT